MKDLIEWVHDIGVPTWVLFVVFVVYAIAKEFRVLEKPAQKTERELLSADEHTFRAALMVQVRQLNDDLGTFRAHVEECENRARECEDRYEALAAELASIIAGIKAAGMDFLIKIGHAPETLTISPQRLTRKKVVWP